MSNPWMKFFPADWRSDPALRLCSRAARGTWIDMLSIMHEATPYGELRVNGMALDARGLAKLLGEMVEDIIQDLEELERCGVFSRKKNGVIYSRELVSCPEKYLPGAKRPWVPNPIQRAVRERDGNQCVYCGATSGPFHLDHVIPWSRGGQHTSDNLVVACQPCNTSKSDMTLDEWRGYNG